jgi:hypothetical protein
MGDKSVMIDLFAGKKTSGEEVFEKINAEHLGFQKYLIITSPGFALGVAAGDIIELSPDLRGRFSVVKRGGNLCIQILSEKGIKNICDKYTARIEKIGGWIDGEGPKVLVYTIPVSVGFRQVEEIMNNVALDFPDSEWYYGNVYDPEDGVTPLRWWS